MTRNHKKKTVKYLQAHSLPSDSAVVLKMKMTGFTPLNMLDAESEVEDDGFTSLNMLDAESEIEEIATEDQRHAMSEFASAYDKMIAQ